MKYHVVGRGTVVGYPDDHDSHWSYSPINILPNIGWDYFLARGKYAKQYNLI